MVSGCKTIYPQITGNSFEACKILCKDKGGVSVMQKEIGIDYWGGVKAKGEYCVCTHNNQSFLIIPRKD